MFISFFFLFSKLARDTSFGMCNATLRHSVRESAVFYVQIIFENELTSHQQQKANHEAVVWKTGDIQTWLVMYVCQFFFRTSNFFGACDSSGASRVKSD